MGRIDFTPAIFLVGLAMVVVLFKYMGGAGGLKNIMGGLNNFISSIFQPVAATPAPAPITPAPAPAPTTPAATTCPTGQTGTPPNCVIPPATAAKPCAERVGEVCQCDSCCNGNGCPGDGNGKITAAGSPGACNCKCDSSCDGGGGSDDNNDGGGGGDDDPDDSGAKNFDEDSPAAKKQNAKIDQCRNLTGATHKACMASVARITIRPARVARIYNWGNK